MCTKKNLSTQSFLCNSHASAHLSDTCVKGLQYTVGNFHRFSDIGDIVPQKWVKWTHRWIKCAENWFQIFLASGLYDHVAFGLENFVTLMKIGMLSRREKIFLHAKIQQIRSRNGWDTAQLMFLPWPFIYWICKAGEANPRKSPKWAFHQ